MRGSFVVASLLLVACSQSDVAEQTVALESPRTPSGLVGSWQRIAPSRLAGEVLTLNADSTASGRILWDGTRDVHATHWVVRFGSRDSIALRNDWRQGFADGGDPDCVLGKNNTGCISMPHLCLGATGEKSCQTFVYVAPDSLLLPDGSRFVRQAPVPMVTLSQ